MRWFYNKTIQILRESDGQLYHGSWVKGDYVPISEISCDVQPANREQIYKDYGYYIDCKYRIFCDRIDIKTGDYIRFEGAEYKVVKIIAWDDYLDLFAEAFPDGE